MSYCKSKVARCAQKFITPMVSFDIENNPEAYVASLPKGKLAIFNQVLYWILRFPNSPFSQGFIAMICGLSRKHVNETLGEFERDGIIAMLYRHKNTSMYKLSSFFTKEMCTKLSSLFGALPLALLISFNASSASKVERLHNIKRSIFISKSLPSQESLYVCARARGLESDLEKIKKDLKREQQSRSMKRYDDLKSIKLTEYGQYRLQDIPEEIVYEIDKRIHRMKERPTKVWNYFIKACIANCKEKGIVLDFTYSRHLAVKNAAPDEGPFIDESFVPTPAPVYTPKQRPSYGNQKGEYDKVQDAARVNEELKKQLEQKKTPVASHSQRELLVNKIRAAEMQIETNPASKFFLGSMLEDDRRKLKALDESESTEEKSKESDMSDKNRTGNIMSKNPGEFNAIKSFVQSIAQSAQPHEFVTKRHDLNTQHEVVEDLVDLKSDFQSTMTRGQFVDSSFDDDMGYDEAYDLLGVDDPFGDRN